MTKWKRIIIWAIAALVLVGLGAGIMYFVTRPTNALPSSISRQLSFSPFVLSSSGKQSASKYQLTKTENGVQSLVFHIKVSGADVTVTQSVQPSQFVDIPNYKDQFLSNVVNQYSTVQTANGVIYLGRADKQNNHQIGVMVEKGLLVFLNPTSELSEQTWRSIGNSLTIQAPDTN
jgi:hypothetical protein